MKKRIIVLFLFFLIINNSFLRGQASFESLNNLPNTIEVNAPEFNTEKKYFFKIDESQNNLIIQDLRISKNDEIHYYQWVYEIPIKNLTSESFEIEKDIDNNNLSFSIKASINNSIISYWFEDGKMSSVHTIGGFLLGEWPYSDQLYSKLTSAISSISNSLPTKDPNLVFNSKEPSTFKFLSKNVVTKNALMAEEFSIGKGYFFEEIPQKVKAPIIKNIKKAFKEQNIHFKHQLPVIVHVNKEGFIESLFIGNEPYSKYCDIDLNSLNSKPIKEISHPTKYLFFIY